MPNGARFKKQPIILKGVLAIPAMIDGKILHVSLIFSIFPKALDFQKIVLQ